MKKETFSIILFLQLFLSVAVMPAKQGMYFQQVCETDESRAPVNVMPAKQGMYFQQVCETNTSHVPKAVMPANRKRYLSA